MMEEIEKKKEFFNNYAFLKSLSGETKSKLIYSWDEKTYSFGAEVYEEGEPSSYIYLIKSGEFQISKDIYLTSTPGDNSWVWSFRRFYSNRTIADLNLIFNEETKILYSSEIDSNTKLKAFTKSNTTKHTVKVAIRGKNDQFGLNECQLLWPYRVVSIKCVSITGTVIRVDSNMFFKKVKDDEKLLKQTAIERMMLIVHSINNYVG